MEKTVNDRAMQKNVPARPRRLAEHDMSNAFAPRKIDQRICYSSGLQFDDFCSEFLTKTNILLKRHIIFGLNPAHLFIGRFNVNCIPITGQASSNARSDAQQLLRAAARSHRNHHFLRKDRLFKSFTFAVVVCFSGLVCRYLPEGQLAEGGEISLAKEIVEGLLDLSHVLNLA